MLFRSTAIILLLSSPFVAGFSFPQPSAASSRDTTALSAGRRDVLTQSAAWGFAAVASSTIGSLPAWADVSDGNTLPQGAQQFSRLIRIKNDLKNVEKRVKDGASEMDNKEWDNVSQFLRQIYQSADDMKGIAGGIFDPEKKKQALADAESLKKLAKATDGPVNNRDGPGFLTAAVKMEDLFEDFLDQLRDIPDEI